MAMIKCPECQKDISEAAYTCPNCGYPLNDKVIPDYNVFIKKKDPGKGLGIAGMVLGIIGVVYSPATLSTISEDIPTEATITLAVFISIFGILAFIFGINSKRKGYKTGKSTSAIVLGSITILSCIITIILSFIL